MYQLDMTPAQPILRAVNPVAAPLYSRAAIPAVN